MDWAELAWLEKLAENGGKPVEKRILQQATHLVFSRLSEITTNMSLQRIVKPV